MWWTPRFLHYRPLRDLLRLDSRAHYQGQPGSQRVIGLHSYESPSQLRQSPPGWARPVIMDTGLGDDRLPLVLSPIAHDSLVDAFVTGVPFSMAPVVYLCAIRQHPTSILDRQLPPSWGSLGGRFTTHDSWSGSGLRNQLAYWVEIRVPGFGLCPVHSPSTRAARRLHRDVCLMTSNFNILHQYVLCLQGDGDKVFRVSLGSPWFPVCCGGVGRTITPCL